MNLTTNHSTRGGLLPDVFIEHYTAGSGTALSTADYMRDVAGNSAHAVIGRGGDIVEPVGIDRASWHAGDHNKAYTRGSRIPSAEQLQRLAEERVEIIPIGQVPYVRRLVNQRSVGVEHVNLGWSYADKPDAFKGRHRNPASRDDDWQPYTSVQIVASREYHKRCIAACPSLRYVMGHEDVTHADSMGDDWRTVEIERKIGAKLDPGPAFPWPAFLAEMPLIRIVYDFARHGWVLGGA